MEIQSEKPPRIPLKRSRLKKKMFLHFQSMEGNASDNPSEKVWFGILFSLFN
jgi:hypothetical protein